MIVPFGASPVCVSVILGLAALTLLGGCQKNPGQGESGPAPTGEPRFLVLDPGHFHAALVFRPAAYEGISKSVGVFAPVGDDVIGFLNLTTPFNTRAEDPAVWEYDLHLGPDFMEGLLKERPGSIVVISGKNDEKIDRVLAGLNAGFHVLVDKPWIIDHRKFALLDSALALAETKNRAAFDIMTERYEITTILQKFLAARKDVFGEMTKGTPEQPAVIKKSVHHISKVVAGKQLRRPWWFFDTRVQGEGLVDVTTHLVDLVFWTLFPEQPIDYENDIRMFAASHWPTAITPAQFGEVTGSALFPVSLTLDEQGNLPYNCNGVMNFLVRDVHVQIQVEWKFKAPEGGGDTHYSILRGSKANVLVLQEKEQNYRPELYIEPAPEANRAEVGSALKAFIHSVAAQEYPGLSVVEDRGRWRIDIPQQYRVGHEAHFGQVAAQFLKYVRGDEPLPAWERPNMLAKYYITTKALEMCGK
ncbi:MAG: putative oxidoreductase C-terminal domain-containing protein [Candidatus Latescibacterota bacterium]